ncbi:hypothetical protein KC327_g19054 [Hortaea werneckii]|nr:hypothetical protein KC327_g19054 [Hortaea werneckii]
MVNTLNFCSFAMCHAPFPAETPTTTSDPFAHSIPPGWKATLKGFARLYLNRQLHLGEPSPSTGPATTPAATAMSAAASATMTRAEKYELFLRGERFFRHPVIRGAIPGR